ncbi:MAG: hypothetical protein K6F34_03790, partial [Lachnospiraceae bacterium]|nr:hypothetical protein [Lachnospiraceae bacterium]
GKWDDEEENVMELDEIKEKPDVDYAEDYLAVATKESKENYFAVFGQYVLTGDVFDAIEENVKNNVLESGEIQLTSALEKVRARVGMTGYLVKGKSYDIGLPEKYYETMINFAKE